MSFRVRRAIIICFMTFTAFCYILEHDYPFIGYRTWLGPGLIAAPVALFVALTLRRAHWRWCYAGFGAFAAFGLWVLLPR